MALSDSLSYSVMKRRRPSYTTLVYCNFDYKRIITWQKRERRVCKRWLFLNLSYRFCLEHFVRIFWWTRKKARFSCFRILDEWFITWFLRKNYLIQNLFDKFLVKVQNKNWIEVILKLQIERNMSCEEFKILKSLGLTGKIHFMCTLHAYLVVM